MKILHVVNISFVLPYYIGDQFNYFSAKGVEFFVACSPSAHLEAYSKEKGFQPIFLNILREINPIADLKSILLLKKKIREEKVDLVIGHTPKGAMIAMIASYWAGVGRRIYFRHGIMFETSTGLKKIMLKCIEKLTGLLATKVICVSKSVMQKSEDLKLNNKAKNCLIKQGTCNGINVNKFCKTNVAAEQVRIIKEKYGITDNDFVLGYVGRLVKDKGIAALLDAWEILLTRHKNIKLLLVGPFEERDSITRVQKSYISNSTSIIHTGLVNNLPLYYRLMDVFILPSYREGFPTVVLEASAMELPVITTRSTGCIDSIVEYHTGLFAAINGESLAQTIDIYLQDSALRTAHGKNGRHFVEKNFKQEDIWYEFGEKILELK